MFEQYLIYLISCFKSQGLVVLSDTWVRYHPIHATFQTILSLSQKGWAFAAIHWYQLIITKGSESYLSSPCDSKNETSQESMPCPGLGGLRRGYSLGGGPLPPGTNPPWISKGSLRWKTTGSNGLLGSFGCRSHYLKPVELGCLYLCLCLFSIFFSIFFFRLWSLSRTWIILYALPCF